jgi:hypothetical protein
MKTINGISRRKFLKQSATAAGALAAPFIVPEGVLATEDRPGANDRVGVGFIGSGGRAKLLMSQMPQGGQIVALADCYLSAARTRSREKRRAGGCTGLPEAPRGEGYRSGGDRDPRPWPGHPLHPRL